jgi:hypothetical protein
MKKLFAAAATAAVLISCNNDTGKGMFTLTGELKSSPDQKIYLEELYFSNKQPEVLDTGEIKNGKFSLSAIAPEEGLYRIRTEEGAGTVFINEGAKINFTGIAISQEPLKGTFTGSANISLQKFIQYSDSISLQLSNKNRLLEAFTKGNVKEDDSIFIATYNEFNSLKDNFTKYSFAYADSAKNPIVALFAATLAPVEISKFEAPLNSLVKRFPKHKGIAGALVYVKSQTIQPQTQSQHAAKAAVGDMAPELAMNDVDDKPFSLSHLKGNMY